MNGQLNRIDQNLDVGVEGEICDIIPPNLLLTYRSHNLSSKNSAAIDKIDDNNIYPVNF